MKKNIINICITLGVALVLFYIFLPPINLSSMSFWMYLIMIMLVYVILASFNTISIILTGKRWQMAKANTIISFSIGFIIVAIIVINFFLSPLFNAKKYATRISVDNTHEFTEDVALVDFTKIPLLDKESSSKLGDRKMGEATDWVSQYYVSDLYTQINYNDAIIRVTPIEYAGIIKYFANHKEGIKGYITVDSVTGEAKLVTLDKGIKYVPSAYFNEDLNRKLRFSYPTLIFDEASFEIDNEGKPYWIVPIIKYLGVGLKKEISGVVILDAISGESKKYQLKDIPSWVDHVYSADLIIEELNNWGEYNDGFINSIFGQKNVVNTTEGYNYLVLNDDVYLYTGITSVSSDESNLGFVLVNMRTKETKFYTVPGAEEYSAMASAEGLVQEKGYTASFPLLINLNNKPTYLLSLKDAAGLVKMYAFVDVADYQKVVVSEVSLGIEAAAQKYLGDENNYNENDLKEETVVITNLTEKVLNGNTIYYFKDSNNNVYSVNLNINQSILPFIKNNDKYIIKYYDKEIREIIAIRKDNNE